MKMNIINTKVLMSGVDYFSVEELNPYSDVNNQPNLENTKKEYSNLQDLFRQAGIEIVDVGAPEGCQDGVYTANWALCRDNKAIIANLPNMRTAEIPYAKKALLELGFEIIEPPTGLRFSGQGDALPCGDYVFAGNGYRSDAGMHDFVADKLGYKVISLQTVPALDENDVPIINKVTGWADSFFYDIDLAISILRDDLIAWCPQAFDERSQDIIAALPMNKIEVSLKEATESFACNLLSTGETVIMSATAPELTASIKAKGLQVLTPDMTELSKGGGYIRCTTLTLSN